MLLDIHEPGETPSAARKQTRSLSASISVRPIRWSRRQAQANLKSSAIFTVKDWCLRLSPTKRIRSSSDIPARKRLADAPELVVSSIKRLMGRGLEDVKRLAGTLPFEVDENAEGMVRLKIAGRTLTPVEVSAEILRTLRRRAETSLNRDITRAVVTVPAYFDDAARTATKDAARLAGLDVLRLINEPTAAAPRIRSR